MSRTKAYLTELLDRIPKWDLPLVEHRSTYDSIKDKLLAADDIHTELRNLYAVHGFGDFALSLLWIAEKIEKDSSLLESTAEEQLLVFDMFRKAVGDATRVPVSESGFVETSDSSDDNQFAASPAEELVSSALQMPVAVGEGFGGDPVEFGKLYDKLTEAVQTGDESRSSCIAQILEECKAISGGDFPSDYRQLSDILSEFLTYITANQFLDDIRVMNLVQNIQDPISQWSKADPSAREGILDQALQVLQGFKQMFE